MHIRAARHSEPQQRRYRNSAAVRRRETHRLRNTAEHRVRVDQPLYDIVHTAAIEILVAEVYVFPIAGRIVLLCREPGNKLQHPRKFRCVEAAACIAAVYILRAGVGDEARQEALTRHIAAEHFFHAQPVCRVEKFAYAHMLR